LAGLVLLWEELPVLRRIRMKCPNDSATLVMSERAGVEIDYCPECRGVWLDRGELDKILDRAEVEASRSVAHPSTPNRDVQYSSRRSDDDDDRDRRDEGRSGYRGKKKEHWLGELFG
jgi:Zn-finger nucleic acid-binding protein